MVRLGDVATVALVLLLKPQLKNIGMGILLGYTSRD